MKENDGKIFFFEKASSLFCSLFSWKNAMDKRLKVLLVNRFVNSTKDDDQSIYSQSTREFVQILC